VPRIEQVELGCGQITSVGASAGLEEEHVVAASHDQCGRLVPTQPHLPLRVERNVGVIVEREVHLNLLAAG